MAAGGKMNKKGKGKGKKGEKKTAKKRTLKGLRLKNLAPRVASTVVGKKNDGL